jgi:hypothetical protein
MEPPKQEVTNRKGFWLEPKAVIKLLKEYRKHFQPQLSTYGGNDSLFPKTDKKVCG